jgi:hypothetical protein
MATWTQADVDRLKAAIVALACGEAVQQVRFDGPPARSVTYQPADLGAMRTLLAVMTADVERQGGTRKGYTLAATRKGL